MFRMLLGRLSIQQQKENHGSVNTKGVETGLILVKET